jgi:putative membrane protein
LWHTFLIITILKQLKMKKIIMPVCLMALLTFGAGCGGNENADSTSTDSSTSTTTDIKSDSPDATASSSGSDTSMTADREFVMEAASGGLMEVELGKIAASNAASAKVKQFGTMMVTDHTKANTELKAVAATKNITVPTAPNEEHQKHIDELKAKKGAEFDKAYVDLMVEDHKEDVSKFENESKDGKDADVKAFATKTLPVLKKHLEHVQGIKDGMK